MNDRHGTLLDAAVLASTGRGHPSQLATRNEYDLPTEMIARRHGPDTANMSAPLLHLCDDSHDAVVGVGDKNTGRKLPIARESPMESPARTAPSLRTVRPVAPCAQCGDKLFAPEWSEYVDERRIKHLWSCDGCGYRFETLVCYPEPVAVVA